MKIDYVNPLWERRHLYAFPISKIQTYVGNKVGEDFGQIRLQREDGFIHVLKKADIVSIDNSEVDFKIPEDKKISVVGSKGDLYDVERVQGIEKCSCPAFKLERNASIY